MESLLGFPGDQEFIKSFREGSKILIARTGGNKDGRFLGGSLWVGRSERDHCDP